MQKMERRKALGLGMVLSLAVAGTAIADSEGVIKYRQGVMKSLAGHMGAMAMIVRGKVDYGANLGEHARGLHALTRMVPALFPEGSDFGETGALPEIWKKPDDFRSKAEAAEQAAARLAEVAASGDRSAVGAAFKEVGKSCKGCHESYREKND
ncbi:MAG: cytochrome c [Gammaproteobacteria bacterium]